MHCFVELRARIAAMLEGSGRILWCPALVLTLVLPVPRNLLAAVGMALGNQYAAYCARRFTRSPRSLTASLSVPGSRWLYPLRTITSLEWPSRVATSFRS